MPRFAANLSMLFTEVEFLDRFELAARFGFQGVEYLFPYAYDPEQLKSRLECYGLTQVLHNLPAGNWEAGERGIACHPDRIDEFRQGVDQAIHYATVLGCQQLNCLAGLLPEGCTGEQAWETLVVNLRFAADRLQQVGIQLLVESINSRVDMPGFFLDTSEKAFSLIEAVQHQNLAFQYDVYHMQIMEGNLSLTLRNHLNRIKHIQIADHPGRHEPGSGEINYPFLFDYLDRIGYQGWVSAEYKPLESTAQGLSWVKPYLQGT